MLLVLLTLWTTVVRPMNAPYVPPQYKSANGRYNAVVHEMKGTITFREGRRKRAVVRVRPQPQSVLVPDSGIGFVALGWPGYASEATLFTIYARDGAVVRTVRAGDLLSDDDREALGSPQSKAPLFTLSGDQLHVVIDAHTIRFDLATGNNLDPQKRDLLPVWRTWSVAGARFPEDKRAKTKMQCAAGVDPSKAIRIEPRELHARAVHRPHPPYPPVARKARIEGTVWAEVVVSESGEIVCTRLHALPFGIEQSVQETLRQWRFAPSPVMVTSDIELHFERITREEWLKVAEER